VSNSANFQYSKITHKSTWLHDDDDDDNGGGGDQSINQFICKTQ